MILQSFFLAYSHNLMNVCIECGYTCLNHNLLVSQNKIKCKPLYNHALGDHFFLTHKIVNPKLVIETYKEVNPKP
jgi:hypothetical protein